MGASVRVLLMQTDAMQDFRTIEDIHVFISAPIGVAPISSGTLIPRVRPFGTQTKRVHRGRGGVPERGIRIDPVSGSVCAGDSGMVGASEAKRAAGRARVVRVCGDTGITPGEGAETAMSELSAINGIGTTPIGRAEAGVRPARPVEVAVRRDADRVEVSREAREAGPRTEGVRRDLVDRVRREIESGTYETDEKLNLAADKVILSALDVRG